MHFVFDAHTLPQLPQLFRSAVAFRQVPLQVIKPRSREQVGVAEVDVVELVDVVLKVVELVLEVEGELAVLSVDTELVDQDVDGLVAVPVLEEVELDNVE